MLEKIIIQQIGKKAVQNNKRNMSVFIDFLNKQKTENGITEDLTDKEIEDFKNNIGFKLMFSKVKAKDIHALNVTFSAVNTEDNKEIDILLKGALYYVNESDKKVIGEHLLSGTIKNNF